MINHYLVSVYSIPAIRNRFVEGKESAGWCLHGCRKFTAPLPAISASCTVCPHWASVPACSCTAPTHHLLTRSSRLCCVKFLPPSFRASCSASVTCAQIYLFIQFVFFGSVGFSLNEQVSRELHSQKIQQNRGIFHPKLRVFFILCVENNLKCAAVLLSIR